MDDQQKPKRETIEIYSSLIRTEVKSLSGHMAEVSSVVHDFMTNFDSILMQIDEVSTKLEAMQVGIDYCKSELSNLRKVVADHSRVLAGSNREGSGESE